MNTYIKKFNDIGISDAAKVGGKNASLGEMFSNLSSKGISVPDGFATTAYAFEEFLTQNALHPKLDDLMR
jgi:pyruvate,water dikinase